MRHLLLRLVRARCRHGRVDTVYFRHLVAIDGAGPGGSCHRNVCLDCGAVLDFIWLDGDVLAGPLAAPPAPAKPAVPTYS